MANITEVRVNISLTNCAKEFKEFLDIAQDGAIYRLCTYTDFDIDNHNSAEVSGDADGRWAYKNNIGDYFPEPDTINKDAGGLNGKAVAAYKRLLQTIADNGGKVVLRYDDWKQAYSILLRGNSLLHGTNGEKPS